MAGAKSERRSAAEAAQSNKRARVEENAVKDEVKVNLYTGFEVPVEGFQVERISIHDITPEDFFKRYVATRTPVVLQGFITDAKFTAPQKWTNEYLRETAGDESLKVEERSKVTEKFGRGVEVDMQFKDMLRLIEEGDEMHYLTTQDVEANEDGRPEIMAPFVAKLQEDFPLQPALLGNLVPQNINIWMGNNKDGSSSGLHHDYHDNLYILLRGKKRFRLYSPADTEKMYTRGKLVKVHTNGRINYEGEETTAYGADPMSEAAALASIEKEDAERELALAEQAVEDGEEGAEARLAAAEDRLDKAMLSLLRADRDEDDDEEEPEDGEFGPFHFEDEDGEDEDADDEEDAEDAEDDAKKVDKTVKDPVNFSRIDTSLLKTPESKEALLKEFPAFEEAKAAFCEINVGEMLFLPASWFHEVESFGSKDGHLALNYWYHPPDQLDNFDLPYSSPFWPRDWEMRCNGVTAEDDDEVFDDFDEDDE
ncbi:hypothetical protein Poli38472_002457 [Pythium oligandrum]|uniref:JmjC domain-containing protein n=1 Tax=Pythium oligandrum TaxID=41045 RepID=A0A8K1CH91_PYTOL|nr:hypothetical protein Poli38472_002457 [Pythium oligandrum]|eukprot:TMW63516.1 hypothetical protein Poli38472_002457 [Pythium oligandrum]